MSDVAAHSGLSLKTVSRVVNGEATVSPATSDRVRASVRALGFRRNDVAATLARGTGQASIGLIIEALEDPFYAHLTGGVERVAREHHHLVLVVSCEEDAERERETALALAARQVAGIIVVPHSSDHRYLEADVDAGLALVFVDRPPSLLTADTVLTDNVRGAREGVAHLLELGHRRIAFVGNEPPIYTSGQRLEGYRQAFAEAGVEVDEFLLALGPRDQRESEEAVRRLLELADPPTAVFSQNGRLTMGVWRAAHASAVPLTIVGFDDFDLADVLEPPVTVVAQDPAELGRQAAMLLFERIAQGGGPPRHSVLPTRLIPRGSQTGPPPRLLRSST